MTRSTSYAIPDHHDPTCSNPSAYHTPLLLVPFPRRSNNDDHDDHDAAKAIDILAYGGDDGCVYLIPALGQQETPRVIRKYDDCVRALAVSADGKRVAVGFDDGSTKIYRFDGDHGAPSNEGRHAFIPKEEMNSQSFSQFDNDDDDSCFVRDENKASCFSGPRLQSPVRQMAFDPRPGDKYFLAIVSEDGDSPLVICDATSAKTVSKVYLVEESAQEHNGGGARSLAYAPPSAHAKPMLSTLGMDGHLLVWNLTNSLSDPALEWEILHRDALSVVKAEPGEGMGSDAADRACRIVWGEVEGKAVCLLPGKTDVQFRYGEESSMLQKQMFLMEGGHKDTIVTMAWEPYGKRFVTGGRDGKLFLWQMALEGDKILGELVREVPIQKGDCIGIPPITSIVWAENSTIYVADASGLVYLVSSEDEELKRDKKNLGTRAMEGVNESNKFVTQPDEIEKEPKKESGLRRLQKKPAKELSDDDDDDMFDEDANEVKDSDETMKAGKKEDASKFIEDEAEDADDDDESAANIQSTNVERNSPSPAKDDTIYDDFDTNPTPQDNTDPEEDIFQTHQDPIDRDQDHAIHQITSSLPPLQSAFAPSSTPINEPRRILCWNHIGVVTTYPDPDSQYSLVDVAFHETAGLVRGRRPINFTDNLGFIVGTLGEEGALFASDLMEEDDDDLDDDEFHDLGVMSEAARKAVKLSRQKKKREDNGKGSHLYFNRFETFGRNADKDWVVALPDRERVMGCAAGRGWCSVITSRRYLRLFTTAGIQGPVIWLPGEPVTLIGRDRFVAVFYHRSATPMQDGTQLLGYSIFDGMKGTTVACGDVSAMSPGSSLTWAGFTEVCALSVMDSEGVLSMLSRQSPTDAGSIGGNWVPMLDTVGYKKSTNDTYWPVEVHGGKLVCVLLRGGKEYPDAGRRPVTTTLSLRMPLARGLTKCGQVEELSVRGKIALEQKKVLNDYNVAQGEGNIHDAEDEYIQLSAQIDKVTLKLFNEIIKAGKVERALSLVNRLHLEKSYDIAIQVSDRMGHRKLSDFIEDAKLQRFPAMEDDDLFDDSSSVVSRQKSDSFDEASITSNLEDQREVRGISPEIHTPKGRHHREVRSELTDEESPPRPRASLKRQLEDDRVVSQAKRLNPFAKKRMESPAKGIIKTPQSPAKLTLSRQSTFSAKSRQKQRSGKQIV